MSLNITPTTLKSILLQILDHIQKNMEEEQFIHILFNNGYYHGKFYDMCYDLEIGVLSDRKFGYCLLFFLYMIIDKNFEIVFHMYHQDDFLFHPTPNLIEFFSDYFARNEHIKRKMFYVEKINDIEIYDVKRIKELVEDMLK